MIHIDVLKAVCDSSDRKTALRAVMGEISPSKSGNELGFYLGMRSLMTGRFLPAQTGQPAPGNKDNKELRRAIRLWRSVESCVLATEEDAKLATSFIRESEKCFNFLRSQARAAGSYCSVDPALPGLIYVGKTDGLCVNRGAAARKIVRLAATTSDGRSPLQLEKWTQDHLVGEKVGTETWFLGEPEVVEKLWRDDPSVWYYRVGA